jgi:hypothetical protein
MEMGVIEKVVDDFFWILPEAYYRIHLETKAKDK